MAYYPVGIFLMFVVSSLRTFHSRKNVRVKGGSFVLEKALPISLCPFYVEF